jgi:hypothetical protein
VRGETHIALVFSGLLDYHQPMIGPGAETLPTPSGMKFLNLLKMLAFFASQHVLKKLCVNRWAPRPNLACPARG